MRFKITRMFGDKSIASVADCESADIAAKIVGCSRNRIGKSFPFPDFILKNKDGIAKMFIIEDTYSF